MHYDETDRDCPECGGTLHQHQISDRFACEDCKRSFTGRELDEAERDDEE